MSWYAFCVTAKPRRIAGRIFHRHAEHRGDRPFGSLHFFRIRAPLYRRLFRGARKYPLSSRTLENEQAALSVFEDYLYMIYNKASGALVRAEDIAAEMNAAIQAEL